MNHEMFDKRQKLPRIMEIESTSEVLTLNEIESFNLGNWKIRFIAPNITALFLEKAEKEKRLALHIYNKIIKPKTSANITNKLTEKECTEFYDYFEHIQTSVIMMFSAVESLVNVLIPENFIYMKKQKCKEEFQSLDKQKIQRYCSIEDKLVKILPEALNIESPNQFRCWKNFKLLKKFRDDIIHTKDENTKLLIDKSIDFKIFNKIDSARQLIIDLKKLLLFNNKFPMLELKEELIIESYKSMEHTNLKKHE